jgi:hypothetical protein
MCYVRCRRCDGRRTLSRHPDSYTRKPPRCRTPGCKSHEYRVDTYRMKHERGPAAPKPCRCFGMHFPHRRTSGFCIHGPNLNGPPQEDHDEVPF